MGGGLIAGLFAADEVGEEEIEKLKQGDMLEASFGDFASESPELYQTIIAERDRYMATRLREEVNSTTRKVLVVVGAGHLTGLAKHLENDTEPPTELRATGKSTTEKTYPLVHTGTNGTHRLWYCARILARWLGNGHRSVTAMGTIHQYPSRTRLRISRQPPIECAGGITGRTIQTVPGNPTDWCLRRTDRSAYTQTSLPRLPHPTRRRANPLRLV